MTIFVFNNKDKNERRMQENDIRPANVSLICLIRLFQGGEPSELK